MAEPTVNLSFNIEQSTHQTLKRVAEKEDRPMSAQARRVLRQWAEEQTGGSAEDVS